MAAVVANSDHPPSRERTWPCLPSLPPNGPIAPRLEVAIHPSDARRIGVETGAPIRVASRRGELTGYAQVTEAVRPGAEFVPFVKLADSAANFLTNTAFDPASKIPEYKVCAVRIEREDL